MEKVKVESSHDEKGKKFKGYKIICNAQLEHERLAIFLMFKNHLYWNNLSTMFYACSVGWHFNLS